MRPFILIILMALPMFVAAQIQTSSSYTPPPPPTAAQSQNQKAQLEAKRKELQDAINETERELTEIKKNKNATISQLRALQYKLSQRQGLINNINQEIGNIDQVISKSNQEILTLKQKLELLKVRYAQSIRYAYTTRSSYDMLAFLFSSSSFNDALRRMKYLKKFREYRKQQVDQIVQTQTQISQKINTLSKQKAEKDELLADQKEQSMALMGDVKETNNTVQSLKGKEAELQRQAERNRKAAAKINKYINDIIQREMQLALRKAEEEERKRVAANKPAGGDKTSGGGGRDYVPPPRPSRSKDAPVELMLTPTDIALAENFEENRGKLYWPVAQGFITDHYGTHPSPIAEKVMVNNDGVDIRTNPNAAIRAVFEGTVSSVFTVEGVNIIVIQHGNYFTVYNNLASVSVSKGQHVKTLQTIGAVANNEEGEPTVKFQVWKSGGKKGQATLNPEQWIGRAK